jgi:putative lipoprotein
MIARVSTAAAGVILFFLPCSAAADGPIVARDKVDHLVVSTAISTETYVIAVNHVPARWQALAIGAGVSLAAGAGKEAWDALGHGDPSWGDFAWDVAGTATGLVLAWGLDLLLRGVDDAHPILRAPAASF